MKQLTFLDLCSGIGGFRLGLEAAGHKCIGYCEYDKFARASYEAMYDTEGEWKADDVTKLKPEEVPYADIWCFGFPCQDISVAGKQQGLVGKRSGIYYNIIDLIKGKEESDRPTYLLVENVKNLLSVNSGFDFASVLSEMDEAGYDCKWQVLNSKDFGVPQNRERVFIIANLRSRGGREILPLCGENAATLKQLIGGMQGYRVYDTDGLAVTLMGNAGGVGARTGLYYMGNVNPSGHGQNGSEQSEYDLYPAMATNSREEPKIFIDQCRRGPKLTQNARCIVSKYNAGVGNRNAVNSGVLEIRPVLTPERMEKRQNGRRMKEDGEPMFTLTAQDRHGVFICEKADIDGETVLRVRSDTKQGDEDTRVGGGGNSACPERRTERGRGGKDCSLMRDCSGRMGVYWKCGRIRRLTPRECFRLQGFPDVLFERAAAVNSDAQLYKQAGNAVTATVAFAVAMSLPESRDVEENNRGD